MRTVFNFSPGPATLPEAVLRQAQAEMLDWRGTGMSVMEVSHRGDDFLSLVTETEHTLRALLNIPAHYKVLFLPGGARLQFAMVPINLLQGKTTADYIDSGYWSKVAIAEAKRFGHIHLAGQAIVEEGWVRLPTHWQCSPDAAFVHYTVNETIEGIEFHAAPDVGDLPLVADMTSNILSQPLDINQFGLIYASAQKNLGQAGITLVIIREDLAGHVMPGMPSMLDYQAHIEHESAYNTPPTYAWYFCSLMLKWIQQQGGVSVMAHQSQHKAQKLYQCIDASDFYLNRVHPSCRSLMNVPFVVHQASLNELFLSKAKAAGLLSLKGHRAAGGIRASLYLGMPEQGVDALVQFMREFERRYG